jgi:hypothetical protein
MDRNVVQKGGVDLLLACGFVRQPQPQLQPIEGLSSTDNNKVAAAADHDNEDDYLVLSKMAKNTEMLVTACKMLTHVALHQLQMSADRLPKLHTK